MIIKIQRTKYLLLFFLLGFFWLCAWAADVGKEPRLPFYEAHKGGFHVFILGTMHAGKSADPIRKEIVDALRKSNMLVLEVSFDELLQAGEMTKDFFCRDACLPRQISPDSYQLLLQEQGLRTLKALGALDRMPAWMVLNALTEFDIVRVGLSVKEGSEHRLIALWKKYKPRKPIVGLEKIEEQFALFGGLDEETQVRFLDGYLKTPESERKKMFDDLYQTWLSGDAEALYTLSKSMEQFDELSPEEAKAFEEALIDERNRRFVDRLLPMLEKNKPVFVGVGALHLGGENGVLSLLRAQGFTVEER